MEIIKNWLLYGACGRPMLADLHFIANNIKKTVIIYIHGFNGFKDWGNFDLIANHFAAHGYFFIKMNLSHNGTTIEKSEEFADLEAYSENNYSNELYDVEKVVDWVCEYNNSFATEIDIEKIVLLGHSRGGGIAIIKASEDSRIKALLTWASVAVCKTPWGGWKEDKINEWKQKGIVFIENKRTKQQMPIGYQLYEDYQNNTKRLDIESAVKLLKIPAQLCHGTNDEAVPFDNLATFKKWNEQCEIVSINSNHVFDRKHPYFEKTIPLACKSMIDQNIKFLSGNGF